MDLYKILGLRTNRSKVTAEDVKKAYRRESIKNHPDKNPGDPDAAERFNQINLAYRILSDPERRSRYDESGVVEDTVSKEREALWGALSDILIKLVVSHVEGGRGVTAVDLLAEMKMVLASGREKYKKEMLRVQKIKLALDEVVKRLKPGEDSDDFLSQAAKAHLKEAENQLVGMEAQLKRNEELTALLKGYTYEFIKEVRATPYDSWGSLGGLLERNPNPLGSWSVDLGPEEKTDAD